MALRPSAATFGGRSAVASGPPSSWRGPPLLAELAREVGPPTSARSSFSPSQPPWWGRGVGGGGFPPLPHLRVSLMPRLPEVATESRGRRVRLRPLGAVAAQPAVGGAVSPLGIRSLAARPALYAPGGAREATKAPSPPLAAGSSGQEVALWPIGGPGRGLAGCRTRRAAEPGGTHRGPCMHRRPRQLGHDAREKMPLVGRVN